MAAVLVLLCILFSVLTIEEKAQKELRAAKELLKTLFSWLRRTLKIFQKSFKFLSQPVKERPENHSLLPLRKNSLQQDLTSRELPLGILQRFAKPFNLWEK